MVSALFAVSIIVYIVLAVPNFIELPM
jgi:hypothetical protein